MKILLIGFMGVGKTTVGQKLAHALGQRFIDLDQAIVAHVGQTPSHRFLRKLVNQLFVKSKQTC